MKSDRISQSLPIFVISLEHAKERRRQLALEFERVGLNYDIFEGVDGTLHSEELLASTDIHRWEQNMGAPLSLGHLGCYKSHVNLWKHLGKADYSVALICEDDITFGPLFPKALESALSINYDWDIIRFSCVRAKGKLPQAKIDNFRLNAYWGPFTGNGCYLIKCSVAGFLAARFLPMSRAHDHELNRFFDHNVRLMGLEPFTAFQVDNGKSYITGFGLSLIKKFPIHRRFPHYCQKSVNYFLRIAWLAKHSMLTLW